MSRSMISVRDDSGEDALINLRRISQNHEADIAHVFLCDALHVGGRYRAKLFEKLQRVAPAAADQFILRETAGLRRVRFLTDIVCRQELGDRPRDVVATDGLV